MKERYILNIIMKKSLITTKWRGLLVLLILFVGCVINRDNLPFSGLIRPFSRTIYINIKISVINRFKTSNINYRIIVSFYLEESVNIIVA